MVDEIFSAILKLATHARPGYLESLTLPMTAGDGGLAPHLDSDLAGLYAVVAGTPRLCSDQRLFDFIPGYRLIHVDETASETDLVQEAFPDVSSRTPFLADYSSCYFLLDPIDGGVDHLDRELGLSSVSTSLASFLATVRECYTSGAYFTDDDGYLDYDDEAVSRIGREMNPGCDHWA